MTRTFSLVAAALLASLSAAEARQSTLNMTCGQAAALVAAQGAIVLSTGQHTFQRFVATPGYCSHNEYGDSAWAPTREGQCRVGYICKIGPPLFEEMLFGR